MYKPYDCGLLVGRFQTFHKGHQSLVETGMKLCDRMLILVGSAQESGTERNPFNIKTRIDTIEEISGGINNTASPFWKKFYQRFREGYQDRMIPVRIFPKCREV